MTTDDTDRVYLGMPCQDVEGFWVVPVYLDGKWVSVQPDEAAAHRYAERLCEELGCTYDVETP